MQNLFYTEENYLGVNFYLKFMNDLLPIDKIQLLNAFAVPLWLAGNLVVWLVVIFYFLIKNNTFK